MEYKDKGQIDSTCQNTHTTPPNTGLHIIEQIYTSTQN